jgi:hypothetical protein
MMFKRYERASARVDGTTGTPLGGFGAGAVKYCAHTGTFAAVTKAPADQNDYAVLEGARLQFYTSRNGHNEAVDTMTALLQEGRYEDDAIWPLHRVNFGSTGGIQVRLLAFSPLAPSDPDLMSMPYAFYELELTNEAANAAEAACAFQLGYADGTAVYQEGKGLSSPHWSVYAASSDPDAILTAGSGDGFLQTGECGNKPAGGLNRTAVKVKLSPGETKTIRFVLAWYDNSDPERAYYLGLHTDSVSVAELGLKHFEALKTQAVGLVSRMRDSNLPDWLVNQTLNTLVNLTNNSLYKKDGRVAFAEGEWTCFGTMDQMWHARQIVNQLVPFFAWQELRYWARTQKENGQIHHDFNTSEGDKSLLVGWDDREHADYRDISKWVDLNCGFIISVFETYRATGDRVELDGLWPHMIRAGQRVLEQVELYGHAEYPYTFEDSENSYDAGGDPNPFNASLSAVAYKVMMMISREQGRDDLAEVYEAAYERVVASYRARYLNEDFPTGRGCESYYAGQWLSLHMKFGEIWSEQETDLVLERLDSYYHPYYWGLGHLGGTYNEWTPYILTHYGGLLLLTKRANQWAALQKDAYNRQYLDRRHVFNHPLDILPAVTEPNYASTTISGDKQYISMPGLWRNYYDIIGFQRDRSTGEIWLQPILPEELNHQLTDAMFVTPEGYGAISCREYGDMHQNREITVRSEQPMPVTAVYLTDHYGAQVTVTVNGEACEAVRTGTGYAKELRLAWNGVIDNSGIRIVASGDPGSSPPPLPGKPASGADSVKPSAIRSAYSYLEAESADETAGVTMVTPVGSTWYVTDCHNFDYIKFNQVQFDEVGSRTFLAKVASTAEGARMEIVLDSVGGEIIGTCPVPHTGGGEQWKLVMCPIAKTQGKHNVILKFYGNSEGNLMNIDKFKFLQDDGRLDRTGWTAGTSRNGLNAYTLLDGDASTGWSIAYGPEGAHILIDMKESRTLDGVTLDHHAEDEPVWYEVLVSADGTEFSESLAAGCGKSGSAQTEITFAVVQARYVKIIFTGQEQPHRITVYELNLWNKSGLL